MIGKVIHYYDKLGVAIVRLEEPLIVGDKAKFVKNGETLFEQEITSMQQSHENIENAKPGDEIGVKTDQEAKPGVELHKI